jgi:hypothetical protein
MSGDHQPTLLLLLVLGGLLPLIVWALWRNYQRRLEAWRAFARRHGWRFRESLGSLEVEGLYQGQQLSLLTERRGSSKNRYTVTVVRLDVSHALPVELSLEPETLGDRFLKLVGKRDEELGDAALDEVFDLKHLSPDARAVLRAPRVARPLLRLPRLFSGFSIEGGLLEVEQREVPDTSEKLEALVAPVLELADALGVVAANPEEQMRG